MQTNTQQDSDPTIHSPLKPKKKRHNLEIRMACVEDGIDNTGFRKI